MELSLWPSTRSRTGHSPASLFDSAQESDGSRLDSTRISADLSGANLKGATFKGADLRGAILKGADLRGADLRANNLTVDQVSDAKAWDKDTVFPDDIDRALIERGERERIPEEGG